MSNLSDLLPAGAGAKSADFVASGTLGSGVAVALKADGTVSVVTETSTEITQFLGTPTTFEAGASNFSGAYDTSTNKVVIAYRNSPGYGTAVVGTVSGTSISFGTPVTFHSNSTTQTATVFDSSSGKIVIAYRNDFSADRGDIIVGTVSGTSISFGSPVTFESNSTNGISLVYERNAQKLVIVYRDNVNSGYGTAIVGTVSGTSISLGSKYVFSPSFTNLTACAYDSISKKIVISFKDEGNSNYGTAVVGTVSGTSISFGTRVVFESSTLEWNSIAFDEQNNKVVIAYSESTGTAEGKAIVGAISGTSISFGATVNFIPTYAYYISCTYDSAAKKIVISYTDSNNSLYGTLIVGTVSGTSISFGSPVVFENARTDGKVCVYDPTLSVTVIGYRDDPDAASGKGLVFRNAYTQVSTNNTSFIGISDQAIANGASGKVVVQGGVSEKLSGLTANTDYYVQADGSISTTVSSVPAGKALSSTSILLKG